MADMGIGEGLMIASLASTAAGTGASAMSTIAGGDAKRVLGGAERSEKYYEATQLEQNAAGAIAAGQRRAFDTQQKARLLGSTSQARAAGSGVDAGTGSAATNVGQIAGRGEYEAAMNIFGGEEEAVGLRNKAAGLRYTGDIAAMGGDMGQAAAELAAAGTIAGGAGSMFGNYAKYKFPVRTSGP